MWASFVAFVRKIKMETIGFIAVAIAGLLAFVKIKNQARQLGKAADDQLYLRTRLEEERLRAHTAQELLLAHNKKEDRARELRAKEKAQQEKIAAELEEAKKKLDLRASPLQAATTTEEVATGINTLMEGK